MDGIQSRDRSREEFRGECRESSDQTYVLVWETHVVYVKDAGNRVEATANAGAYVVYFRGEGIAVAYRVLVTCV